jgi:hypothetical protein
VVNPVVAQDVAPLGLAALRAKELFKPFVAEDKYWMGLYHQLGFFVAHATGPQFFWLQKM